MFDNLYNSVRNTQLSRDMKIFYLITIIVVGFALVALAEYYGPAFPRLHFAYDLFPAIAFGDFGSVTTWQNGEFNLVGLGSSYFPATYLISSALTSLSQMKPHIFSAIVTAQTLFLGFVAFFAYVHLKSDNKLETFMRVFACTFMTYPVLFTFNTGNIESFVFIFLALFVYWYHQKKYALSVIPLGMAIAMKLFPIVFLVLLLADKKYKELFYVIGWIALFTLFPLTIYDGGISDGVGNYLAHLRASQKMYADLMIMSPAGNHYGHSLINGVWMVMGNNFPDMHLVLLPWFIFASGFFAVVAAYIVLVETVFWKRVALTVICMCLLPYTSTDYKLLHFFIPLFLFINDRPKPSATPRTFDLLYIVCFSLLLVSKAYFYFHHNTMDNSNVLLNPILMLVILATIIGTGMQDNGWKHGMTRLRGWWRQPA